MGTPIALTLFGLSVALNLAFGLGSPDLRTLLAALGAWFIADLLSGLVHMSLDYLPCRPGLGMADLFFYPASRASDHYQSMRRDILGRVGPFERILFDFKVHHPRPLSLGRRSLIYQVKSTIFYGSLPFSLALNLVCLLRPLTHWAAPSWLVIGAVVLIVAGTLSQYFHGSLHREANPWMIRALRRAGLLMTPEAHAKHHATLRRDFATINGWSNPVVNVLFGALIRWRVLDPAGLEPS